VLSGPGTGTTGAGDLIGPAAIAAACLCWAIDNNLTRRVSAADALFIAAIKGLIAGTVNTALAVALGAALPGALSAGIVMSAMTLGLLSYGASLVLFVLALRGLGAARTGAYFSTAPFIGAAVSLLLFREPASTAFWAAAALMAAGVWLHLTERHEHAHSHGALTHTHPHYPDSEHRHSHL
jgi:drug/metabolite transporter (DMT)-like permease